MTVVALLFILLSTPARAAGPAKSACGAVSVDPRVELAAALQTLIPALEEPQQQMSQDPARKALGDVNWGEVQAYRRALRERVAPYKNESSVQAVAAAAAELGSARSLERFLLNLEPPPSFKASGGELMDGNARQEALRAALEQFSRKSGFETFFREQEPLYRRLEAGVLAILGPEQCLPAVQGYLGMGELPEYRVVITPGLISGPLNTVIQSRVGPRVLVTARAIEDLMPYLETSTATLHLDLRQDLRATAWHEQAHTVIDPLVRASSAAVTGLAGRYNAVQNLARRTSWDESLGEHFVRAVTSRLVRKEFGAAAAARIEAEDAAQGYLYAAAARKPLAAYEKDRKRYPRIEDFFPEWLKAFGKETAR